MKKIMLVLALLVLVAFTGSVVAEPQTGQTETVYVNAGLSVPTYTVTVPVSVEVGQLNRMADNQHTIDGVSVRSDVPWILTVSSNTPYMAVSGGTPALHNPFMIYIAGGSALDYVQSSTGVSISGSASGSDIPIAISYRQLISPDDVAGTYQIPLVFTVTTTS